MRIIEGRKVVIDRSCIFSLGASKALTYLTVKVQGVIYPKS